MEEEKDLLDKVKDDDKNSVQRDSEQGDPVPEKRDYVEEILGIIRGGKPYKEIKEALLDYHDNDIAGVLELLSPEERKKLYRIIGVEATSDIFSYIDDDIGAYLEELSSEKAADVIEAMDANDAVDVLDELDEEKREELLNLIDNEAAEEINLIVSYDDDQIGSRMSTNFIVIDKDLSVKSAMKSLIDQAAENDNISTIYVVNKDETFYGAIDLKELIIARQDTELDSIVFTSYPYVYASETIEKCIEDLKDYSEDSIPVLSDDNMIIGVITAQDLVEVVDEELGDDYAKLAGLSSEDDLSEPMFKSVAKRLPWLILLLVLGLLVSAVVGSFETIIAQLPLIICFQSLILGMSGNVGTQSLAVTIRILTDDDMTLKKCISLVLKEIKVGFINGSALGVISFAFIGVYIKLFKDYSWLEAYKTSGCVGIALCVSMVISSFSGTIIPLIFKKLKVDPAVASGPMITTINDLVAVVTYYGLAWLLLLKL